MGMKGRWRIIEMELWDEGAIDLVGPAFIELRDDQGSFRFIAVEGWMDVRDVERDGRPGIEFSWEGNDEMDRASGRGWATLGSRRLAGGADLLPHGRRLFVSSRSGEGWSNT
jgi:hypothetical protein